MYARRVLALRVLLLCVVLISGCEGTGAEADATTNMNSSTDPSTGASAGETDDSTGAAGGFVSIIDHHQWQMLDAVADPLAEHRPPTVECGIAGWYLEDEKLEVDTNNCNYLALRQPSLVAIEVGQPLNLYLYHFDLVAPAAALAHLAILVDGEVLWEQSVQIPGEARVFSEVFVSPLSAPAGAEVVFHLHNHGQNTWALRDLAAAQN